MPASSPLIVARPRRIVFVCTGNICRSPTAHAVLRQRIAERGLGERLVVESAGLETWHAGEAPDARSVHHARLRGYDLSDLRARPFSPSDFERADWVLVMDDGHLQRAARMCPPAQLHKLRLLLDFALRADAQEVPDPYHGGPQDFERVLDLIEDACEGLLAHLGHGP